MNASDAKLKHTFWQDHKFGHIASGLERPVDVVDNINTDKQNDN